jgi:hypothetical protein
LIPYLNDIDSIIKKAAASGHGDKVAVIGIQFIYLKEHPGEIHFQLFTIHSKKIGYSLFGQFVFINQVLINKVSGKKNPRTEH